MTTMNLKAVQTCMGMQELKKEGFTWGYTLTESACKKQVRYIYLVNNDGLKVAESKSITNISNKDEIFTVMHELIHGNIADNSMASAKVEHANERGNLETQSMTYVKHDNWVELISNKMTVQATKKDPHLNNVLIEDLRNFNIREWVSDTIINYIYTLEDLKSYNLTLNDNFIMIGKNAYITKHTRDCYLKAIKTHYNYVNKVKRNKKVNTNINIDLKNNILEYRNTCMV